MTVTTFSHINLDYLDTMTDGDGDMKKEMLTLLTAEIPEEILKMQASSAISDWEEVFQISHKLKTTFAFVGNDNLTTLNKTIEHCARHLVDVNELPSMIEQLSSMSKPVVVELRGISGTI